MRSDPVFAPVSDRPQVEVVCLEAAEVAFDVRELLVGAHGAGRVEGVGGDGGADDVDPVEGGFGVDLVGVAGDA